MKRYTITLGASTTAGGKVTMARANGSINGVKIAVEGDLVFCPACKTQGKIQCVEPRIPEMWNGKKIALGDDLCICGCPNPPRLIPNQSLRCQNLSDVSSSGISAQQNAGEGLQEAETQAFDDRYILLDESSREPFRRVEYALKRANGYDFKYGAIKGKRNDPWRFADFSTHPGPGYDGVTTAAGMYQINKQTWQDHGEGAALPIGRGQAGRHNQPYVTFDHLSL
ncbi:PAAR domain-containing protein [Duganella vulcania]|uniref:PAAR domain-containing protein n=1 Tax=Duganella vulcania TaxID=2692166 RepID=UPI00353151E7